MLLHTQPEYQNQKYKKTRTSKVRAFLSNVSPIVDTLIHFKVQLSVHESVKPGLFSTHLEISLTMYL